MKPGHSEIPDFKEVKTVPQPQAGNLEPAGKHWLDASISGNRSVRLTTKLKKTTIREELDKVREGARESVIKVRAEYENVLRETGDRKKAKGAANGIKAQECGYVTLHGSFTERKNDALIQHSGVVMFDLDDLADVEGTKARLTKCRHVGSVFRSVRATGLRVLVPVTPIPTNATEHKAAYYAIVPIIETAGEITVEDHAGEDVSRASFITSDPTVHINESAIPVEWQREQTTEKAQPSLMPEAKDPLPPDHESDRNGSTPPELVKVRRDYVEKNFRVLRWLTDTKARIECPGISSHSTLNRETDCACWIGGTPSIRCFHASCRGVVEAAERRLRMDTAETIKHLSMNGPAPEIDRDSILERLSKVAFDADHPPPEEPVVLSIAGVEVCHPGNITVIEAHQKSGKSSFVSAGIASTFAFTDFDSLGWQSDGNRNQSTVLHFDTEQSRGDHYRLVMRALARAGLSRPPTWFESYSLTGWSCSEMRIAIEAAVDRAAAKHGGVHSIWIDGVADVVQSPNDEAESFEFVRWLQKMAIARACPIVGVLHLNPGKDGKSRGHLGSELNRKAETVLRLKKDGDVTIVTTEASRRAPIPIAMEPRFAWSEEAGRHTSVSSNRTDDVEVAEARKLVAAIWRGNPGAAWKYRKLVYEIMRCGSMSESSAKRQIKVIQELNLVEKASTGGGYVLTAEGLKYWEPSLVP